VLDAARSSGLLAFHPPTGDHGQRMFNEDLRRKRAELEIDIPVKDISDVDDEVLFGDEPVGERGLAGNRFSGSPSPRNTGLTHWRCPGKG
jgi:hypothetical protein